MTAAIVKNGVQCFYSEIEWLLVDIDSMGRATKSTKSVQKSRKF